MRLSTTGAVIGVKFRAMYRAKHSANHGYGPGGGARLSDSRSTGPGGAGRLSDGRSTGQRRGRAMRAVVLAAGLVMATGTVPMAGAAAQDRMAAPEQPGETWAEIRAAIFPEDLVIAEAGEAISLEAPYRAHDAAAVPVRLRIDPGPGRHVDSLTLIVDENPAPVAATFTLGEAMGPVIEISTRLRVNAYSNVRAVVGLSDGSWMQTARYVKASGGCSAPATGDPAAALAAMGKMKMRLFDAAGSATGGDGRLDAQVMIRHPNNSGFQLDQVTQLYVPPRFVDRIAVFEGDRPLFALEGGISLSEDPSLRFRFTPAGTGPLRVEAEDTDGAAFAQSFPLDAAF
ncbi:quinoprotein dehydrogenase-associated SoxYZ-like carrier [Marinibacterium sp. SX1]|uniref:quinoprotein dehydrogenase-associated SoxYZ-like carrier n=1 Tax=Marinibacterium sp. SX1 TaxID=3388424 RepID=UPI003D17358E